MVTIAEPLRRLKIVGVHSIWLASRPRLRDGLRLARYLNCECTKPVLGFVRLEKFAQEIDLTRSGPEILASFRENTKYEIRRAERESFKMKLETDKEAFRELYDRFAGVKGVSKMNPESYRCFWPHCTVTKLVHSEETLVMHAHIADPVSQRVTLVYSVSLWQETQDPARK